MCGISTAIILHGTAFLAFKYHGFYVIIETMNSKIIMSFSTMAIAAMVLLFASGPIVTDHHALAAVYYHGHYGHYHGHYYGHYGHYGHYHGHYGHYHGHY